jgi:HEAT repeats
MPDLEAFEALVKQNIKMLAAKDAKTRRRAAAWLGEAGDPTAITALAQAYKNDPDPGVQETARYALGMFRKLELELDGPNNDKVVNLLEDVALRGKIGGRPRVSTRSLVKLELGLLISAVLVAALSFILPPIFQNGTTSSNQNPNTVQPTPNGGVGAKDARATLLAEIRQTWVNIGNDASTLQQQFLAAQNGTALDCTAFFNNPAPYSLSDNNRAAFSDIAELVDLLNTAQTSLSASESAFQQACDKGGTLTNEAAGQEITTLQTMMNMLPEIGQKLVAAESQS